MRMETTYCRYCKIKFMVRIPDNGISLKGIFDEQPCPSCGVMLPQWAVTVDGKPVYAETPDRVSDARRNQGG